MSEIDATKQQIKEKAIQANEQLSSHWFVYALEFFSEATILYKQLQKEIQEPELSRVPELRPYYDVRVRLCDLISGRKRLGKDDVDVAIDTARSEQGQDTRPKNRIEIVDEKQFKKMDVRRPG